jgi:hypothetical protein
MAFEKNKIIDLTEQSSAYYNYINKVIGILLSKDDILSISNCKKILNANPLVHKILTVNMREENAIKMIQLISSCSSLYYQYIFPASWFTYFLTTFSGIKKIYHFIFQNPIYGLLFYCTFYFKILDTSDKTKFNQIATVLQLPTHEDASSQKFLDSIVNNSSKYLEVKVEYKEQAENLMRNVATNILSTTGQKTLENIFVKVLETSTPEIKKIKQPAIYISDRDRFDFDDTIIQEQLEMLSKNRSNIKKFMKEQGVNLKKKEIKKKAFLEISQLKDSEGNVICLDTCKNRVKTKMGCYCESDCGPTTFLGGKNWCWVDKSKCKKGKHLLKGLEEKTYDICNPEEIDTEPKCFTGISYTKCKTK